MAETEGKPLKDYVIVPRYIARDYRSGTLKRAERDVYLWMRINGNPYGIAVVSLESLAEDVFGSGKQKNYINQILLSLKKKRYIYYGQRAGRRGSFEVHFGDWLLPHTSKDGKAQVKTLDSYFDAAAARRNHLELTHPHSELYSEVDAQFQTFEQPKGVEEIKDLPTGLTQQNRGSDNDTEPEPDTKTNHKRLPTAKRELLIDKFSPRSYEEELCLEMARELGEPDMRFLLGSLRKHGIQVIEKAFIEVRKAIAKGGVSNSRRLFNFLVQQAADPLSSNL